MTILAAGFPLEPPRNGVGRRTALLVDDARGDRMLGIDCWYPSADTTSDHSIYELLPGLGFTASARHDAAPASGTHPLLVWSHGRTGTRSSYAMLCEAMAARGFVVVAPDHPGDTLADWMLGAAADDETNESQRFGDIKFVLDTVVHNADTLSGGVAPERIVPDGISIDAHRIAVAGHSYGGHTALAFAGSLEPDPRVKAVAGLQSFTRTMRRSTAARIGVPLLMVAAARDETTPPETDADRVFSAAGGPDARRVDVEQAGHQACSDVGLYLELAPLVEDIPDIVAGFVNSMANNVTGTAGDPWRPTVTLHAQLLGSWLDDVLDRDRTAGQALFNQLVAPPGVALRAATK